MTALEKDIERALRRMVEKNGGLCLKWVCPGWSGIPDRIILLPRGRIIFAETKRPKGGTVSPRQAWWSNKLTALGFWHEFIWDLDDVKNLEWYIKEGEHEVRAVSAPASGD